MRFIFCSTPLQRYLTILSIFSSDLHLYQIALVTVIFNYYLLDSIIVFMANCPDLTDIMLLFLLLLFMSLI